MDGVMIQLEVAREMRPCRQLTKGDWLPTQLRHRHRQRQAGRPGGAAACVGAAVAIYVCRIGRQAGSSPAVSRAFTPVSRTYVCVSVCVVGLAEVPLL